MTFRVDDKTAILATVGTGQVLMHAKITAADRYSVWYVTRKSYTGRWGTKTIKSSRKRFNAIVAEAESYAQTAKAS